MTPMRSATVIASSWSWVTITKVSPSRRCSSISSNWVSSRSLLVERRQRLVEQQHVRALGERAGQRHALALAAGELMRLARAEAVELDQRQHLVDARGDLVLRQAVLLEPNATLPATVRCGNSA